MELKSTRDGVAPQARERDRRQPSSDLLGCQHLNKPHPWVQQTRHHCLRQKAREYLLTDVAVPSDHNVKVKEIDHLKLAIL